MLDVMAGGSMPNEDQLRIIAAASGDEQAQVWKKHRPKKGQDATWHEVARALSKRRIPVSVARFDEDLARAHGVVWEDDLFAPAGEDGRTTTNVEGFFGAQREWLVNNLPERGTLLATDEYGRYQLPKKAEIVYGKLGKRDYLGHYIDPHSGEVRTVGYRMPEPKKAGKDAGPAGPSEDTAPTRTRPAVSQKGVAMIGDLRTDALHQALRDAPIDDQTLLALLVLAFGGDNVSVMSGASQNLFDRRRVCHAITEGGMLTRDPEALRGAARSMLVAALSCRANATSSGDVARIAGDAIGATLHLPNMATEAFLACLSKAAIEKVAAAEGVRVEVRGKDTRARLIERFKDGVYVFPEAVFALTEEEVAEARPSNRGAMARISTKPARRAAPGMANDEADEEADAAELPDEHDHDAAAPPGRSRRRARPAPAAFANAAE